MTQGMHAANKRYWDCLSPEWQALRDQDQLWRRCPQEPALAFEGEALALIEAYVGERLEGERLEGGSGGNAAATGRRLDGKKACVIGSGDNYAAFALAGMGARVTSVDISEPQLQVAAQRAQELGLEIEFVRADAAGLEPIGSDQFDLLCSTNGFFVWIAEPRAVFDAVHRVLKPGGYYIFYDLHPFLRPWKDQAAPLEMEKPYTETGPFVSEDWGQPVYEFNWRLSDLLNPLLESGLRLRRVAESPPRSARFWQDSAYLPGDDPDLLDWRTHPRAGLPAWLTVAAQKDLAA